MNTTVDGEFQRYAVESGAYAREHFFGPDPRLRKMVEHLTDDEIRNLPRGGHDYRKLYAAYKAATEQHGAPTVILAKTIKGWTLGPDVEGRNATHQIKKMTVDQLRVLRERLFLTDVIAEEALADDREPPYIKLVEGSAEHEYMLGRRKALDGPLPSRVVRSKRPLGMPEDKPFDEVLAGSGKQEVSTTMAFTRLLRNLCRDPNVGRRVVPIIPDEARTFGMDALFKEFKIYAALGQAYEPVDAQLLLSYSEAQRRPGAGGGHHRGRVDGVVHRRRHQLRPPRRAHAAVLHLLLDVRLPAGRRPHLVGGRLPGPGLPARRHRRADHAAGRGPPAPGRPQPHAGVDRADRGGVGPGLRLRDGDDRPPRHRGDAGRRARRHLLPHALQRELPDAAGARGRRAGHHRRPLPVGRRARGAVAPGDDPVLGHRPGRGPRRPGRAGRAVGRGRRAVVGHQLQAAPRGGAVGRALEPPAPDRAAAHPAW